MADVLDLNNEGKAVGREKQIMFLEEGIVTFTNERIVEFIQLWLEDVADLGDSDDSAKLTFPEGL